MNLDTVWPSLVTDLGETKTVEYKSPAPWGLIHQKLMRAVIAMANNEDGGYIVVGVKSGSPLTAEGLNEESLASYNLESVQKELVDCAVPRARLTVHLPQHDGKTYFVIAVEGLRSLPHIARRDVAPDKQGILKAMAYGRTNIPSSEPCNEVMWESILSYAEPRIAANFVSKMRQVGCGITFGAPPSSQTDTEKFEEERGDF